MFFANLHKRFLYSKLYEGIACQVKSRRRFRSASHVPDEPAQAERSAIESGLMNAQFTKELSFDAATYFEDDCVCPKKKNP